VAVGRRAFWVWAGVLSPTGRGDVRHDVNNATDPSRQATLELTARDANNVRDPAEHRADPAVSSTTPAPQRKPTNAAGPTVPSQPRFPGLVGLVAVATLANGLLGVLYSLVVRVPVVPSRFYALFPYGVHHWSKHLALASGFVLMHLSYQLLARRRTAWFIAVAACGLVAVGHLGRGHHPALAIAPASTVALLLALRSRFTVRSEPHGIRRALLLVPLSLVIVLAYGTAGFWLLDRRDFGIEFHWATALMRAWREYSLQGNPDLAPRTHHALWFLDSMDVLGVTAVAFAVVSLYRPLANRLRTVPHESAHARDLVRQYGRSSLDYFKAAPDNSFFFGAGGRCVVAYRVAWGVAIVLGDPVGPPEDVETTLRAFSRYAYDNGWRVALHQVLPDFVPLYRELGLHVLKIGEEALVDLEAFVHATQASSAFRRVRRYCNGLGLYVTVYEPPCPADVLDEIAQISNEWLSLPGRRERGFTLGRFSRDYARNTPVYVVRNRVGRGLAFVNLIPSWPAGDTTTDLMRHRVVVPNGTMDFLLMESLVRLGLRFRRFSLGLAPLAGVGDRPGASVEERAVHQMYERLNRFFSYKGLRKYKAKFAPSWEDRYLVYQGGAPGLLKTGLALTRITES
jgi:phosphatidylglycerol lysyltransferase